jgi:GntR family transcriptional regulator, transcriptional repressor for pyruvate dehydrogenase complex
VAHVTTLRPIARSRAYELAAEQIKQMIVDGIWRLGDRIPSERELAEQLAISRGSTREALRMLEAIGWLEIRPGEGAIVRDPSRLPLLGGTIDESFVQSARLGEIWEARKIIEPQAAFLAAERCAEPAVGAIEAVIARMEACAAQERWVEAIDKNPDFHLAVARAAENGVITHIQEVLSDAVQRATRRFGPAQTPDRVRKVIGEHRAIFEAIRSGDPEGAQRAGFDHLVRSWMAEWGRKAADEPAG